MAEWLCSGLQNRGHRFNSGSAHISSTSFTIATNQDFTMGARPSALLLIDRLALISTNEKPYIMP